MRRSKDGKSLDPSKELTDIRPLAISTTENPANGREFLLLRSASDYDLPDAVRGAIQFFVEQLGTLAPYLTETAKSDLDTVAGAAGFGYPEPAAVLESELPNALQAVQDAMSADAMADALTSMDDNDDLTPVREALSRLVDMFTAVESEQAATEVVADPEAEARSKAAEPDPSGQDAPTDAPTDEPPADDTGEEDTGQAVRVSASALAETCERVAVAAMADGESEVATQCIALMQAIRQALPLGGVITLANADEGDYCRSINGMADGMSPDLMTALVDAAAMFSTVSIQDDDAAASAASDEASVNESDVASVPGAEAVKSGDSVLEIALGEFTGNVIGIFAREIDQETRAVALQDEFNRLGDVVRGMISVADAADAAEAAGETPEASDVESRVEPLAEELSDVKNELEQVKSLLQRMIDSAAVPADVGSQREPVRRSLTPGQVSKLRPSGSMTRPVRSVRDVARMNTVHDSPYGYSYNDPRIQ